MDIEIWREKVGKLFPEYVISAEIGLSVIHQLCIKDISNPFGLVLVDVPSSGKTIVLNFFSELKDIVYATDNFTPASFVTHASEKNKEDLEKIDLLPKIKDKVFLVRDLAPIFGMRDDDLLKTMGILTRVFDGEGLLTESGLHGQRGYKGRYNFMFLGASTPISPRVWKVMGGFGSRLFFFVMNTSNKDYIALAKQLKAKFSPKKKVRFCREYSGELIKNTFKGVRSIWWDREEDAQSLLEEIAIIAMLVASLRGIIKVWLEEGFSGDVNYTSPQIEKPDRINQALYNLARGHAVACGRMTLNDEDIAIALSVALSSAPLERVKLFKLLIKNNGELNSKIVMSELGFSNTTSLRLIGMFQQLKIIDVEEKVTLEPGRPEKVARIKEEFSWFLSSRFKKLNNLLQGLI